MTPKEELFLKNLEDFKRSLYWLKRGLEKVADISKREKPEEEDFEKVEVLFSRFSRTVDMLMNRILRGIDLLELEDVGTKLDIVIRAEKRGFVEDYRKLIALKDLRNELSHEYVGEELLKRLPEVVEASKEVLAISEKALSYIEDSLIPKLRGRQ